MKKLVLKRFLQKRANSAKINAQVQHLLSRGLSGARGKTWEVSRSRVTSELAQTGDTIYTCNLAFDKKRGKNADAAFKQWQEIKAMIQQTGAGSKYQPCPWHVSEPGEELVQTDHFKGVISDLTEVLTSMIGIREIQPFGPAKKWDDLKVPNELLGKDSDKHLAEHPAWKNLYGVNPQIRIILSNIQRAHETGGESRNHAVLFGHSGCGKSTTMFALEEMFGSGSVLKLDATSTTKAGLENLFFSDLKEIPPLVFMEEAEKADPEALKIWLGALDDRGEIRKINFRINQLRSLKIQFICSVNNKSLFDKMMGSDGTQAGALSSRCVTQVYFPRPNADVLHQILSKEIREKGGRMTWIEPAIAIAQELGVTDPRTVRSYLAGGDRLLDGTYRQDWLAVNETQKTFGK